MTKAALVLFLLAGSLPAIAQSGGPAPATVPAAKPLAFDVVTIRPYDGALMGWNLYPTPDGYTGMHITLYQLVKEAYGVFDEKFITGGPAWISSDRFDLQAKFDPSDIPNAKNLPYRQRADMLRAVLADRFQLKVHFVTKVLPVYNLVVADGGSKLIETKPEDITTGSTGAPACLHTRPDENFNSILVGCQTADLADALRYMAGRPVFDKTGLSGRYNFKLRYMPESAPIDSPLAGRPTIFKAVQEQLGLKLEPGTAPMDILVIDSAQRPTPN
jgi:uncharacterized protein (TIGR03435 family)